MDVKKKDWIVKGRLNGDLQKRSILKIWGYESLQWYDHINSGSLWMWGSKKMLKGKRIWWFLDLKYLNSLKEFMMKLLITI